MCQRRIVKGIRTYAQKRYMVYLVKSRDPSRTEYDSWLCGGALVSPSHILTAAACITDLDNVYAIAGYRKYVNGMDLDNDNCTKINKRRIVKIRVPREHLIHLHEYANSTQWMSLDIGVATVEHPYDFQDVSFRIYCSYVPAAIEINYDRKLDAKIGTNVIALGWGREKGSKTQDAVDGNSETLREVSTTIHDKEDCIKQFKGNGLSGVVTKYMLCTQGRGLLDGEGYIIEDKNLNDCSNDQRRTVNGECNDEDIALKSRKFLSRTVLNETYEVKHNRKSNISKTVRFSRRQGICQNDHGGPLITWVGSTELLIGIAVNSLYDVDYNCVGPYMFISTAAAGDIIRCLISRGIPRRSCTQDAIDGYDIIENVTKDKNIEDTILTHQEQDKQTTNVESSGAFFVAIRATKKAPDDFSSIEVVSL